MVLETGRFVLGAERLFWHKGTMTTFSQHSNRKARDVAAEIVADFTRS